MYLVSVEPLTRLDVALLTRPEQGHLVPVSFPRYLRQVVSEMSQLKLLLNMKTRQEVNTCNAGGRTRCQTSCPSHQDPCGGLTQVS